MALGFASLRSLFDWLVVVVAITVALALSNVNPDYHTFSLLDLNISNPVRAPKVSLGLFVTITIVAPVVIILVTCSSWTISTSSIALEAPYEIRKRKLLEIQITLLGLGISLATATMIFTGMKNLTGKPRPNFLATCQPDLSRIRATTIGGYGQEVSRLWVMVTGDICKQADRNLVNDGFRSFPSGYATIALASLWYLTLFLFMKISAHDSASPTDDGQLIDTSRCQNHRADRRSPPVIWLALPYVPFGVATFLAGTRYFDSMNHGFDVLAGAAIGTVTAWIGFRWVYPPVLHVS